MSSFLSFASKFHQISQPFSLGQSQLVSKIDDRIISLQLLQRLAISQSIRVTAVAKKDKDLYNISTIENGVFLTGQNLCLKCY